MLSADSEYRRNKRAFLRFLGGGSLFCVRAAVSDALICFVRDGESCEIGI